MLQMSLNDLFQTKNVVVEAPLTVLAPVKAPAVIIETGFLTNPEDLELLINRPQFQERLAETIARVVSRFVSTSSSTRSRR
jgi:N-acetylmuramoyl-L-alanine amidase